MVRGPTTRLFLRDDSGTVYELIITDDILRAVGGSLNIDRKRVTLSGELAPQSAKLRVTSISITPVK